MDTTPHPTPTPPTRVVDLTDVPLSDPHLLRSDIVARVMRRSGTDVPVAAFQSSI